MCPQFVDFDGDGQDDIITATYAGTPFIVRGSETGWQQPEVIVDENGNDIRFNIYWDNEKSRWAQGDGEAMQSYAPENHCVSAAVFDWDDDGDYDLLLGTYGGKLVMHENIGKPGSATFRADHTPVHVAGKPFHLEGGLTAPRLVDWDGDGLIDIVTGGFKGGVYFYRNTGTTGAPEFAAPVTLIAKAKVKPDGARFPTSGCYVDPTDYDGDGDLDLIVGGYAEWMPNPRELTQDEKSRLEELKTLIQEKQQSMQKFYQDVQDELEAAETPEAQQAIYQQVFQQEAYQALQKEFQELWTEQRTLQPTQQREAGVWLYRRK